MDVLATKPIERSANGKKRQRDGAAMATALFVMSAVAILTAGVHAMTRADIRTTTNRESAVRALTFAEAAASHALAIMRDTLGELSYTEFLRGPDNAGGNADDGLLTGRTLSSGTSGNDIPLAGRAFAGGTYTVKVIDDPADTDGNATTDQNSRVIVRCTGYGPDGARIDIDVMVGGITLPGFVFDGPLTVSGNPQAIGRCGGIHANGAIGISGTLTANGPITSSSTVSGSVVNPSGGAVTPLQNQPVAAMPEIDPARYCATAIYRFEADGDVWNQITNVKLGNANSTGIMGWKRAGGPPLVKWDHDGSVPTAGSMCFEGNVTVGSNVGTAATPARWSIYATGSVKVSGNPYLQSFDADSMLIVSGGDVSFSGNPDVGVGTNYGGGIYAKYQCGISGNPTINGQVICDNDANQPTSTIDELENQNKINGNPTMAYNCNNKSASTRRFMGWMQTVAP